MNKKIILISITIVLLLATVVIAKEQPNGQPFQAIWNEIARIWEAINNIELQPGPPGPSGPPGEQGSPGECSCDISQEDLDVLEARIAALEGLQECVPNDTRDCGSDVGECQFGTETCEETFTWGECVGAIEPIDEICDGLDNDCDTQIDEDWDFMTDTENCGGCGNECLQSTPLCIDGVCSGIVGETCSDAIVLMGVNEIVIGDTTPYENDYEEIWGPVLPCSVFPLGGLGRDMVYSFTPIESGGWRFDLTDEFVGAELYVAVNCADIEGSVISCSDDPFDDAIEVRLSEDFEYFIIVDGIIPETFGPFVLEVRLSDPIVGWTCFGIDNYDLDVCSTHGTCVAPETCECDSDHTSNMCETPICNGVAGNDPSVCSGHGACVDGNPPYCICEIGWTGSDCNIAV